MIALSNRSVFAHHAKSFYWAAFFLPHATFREVAELYTFCRMVDDVADCQSPEVASRILSALQFALKADTPCEASELYCRAQSLLQSAKIEKAHLLDLLEGAMSDLREPVRLQNLAELRLYCYRVAGVVGLMMCPLLGVTDPRALQHAMDLGIAMQITNICRDVAEDARNNRIYLPQDLLAVQGLSAEDVLRGDCGPALAPLVRSLLQLADQFYRSGEQGMRYIPWRTRLSIRVAARIYRAIGGRLAKMNFDPWQGRARVSLWRKVALTSQVLVQGTVSR